MARRGRPVACSAQYPSPPQRPVNPFDATPTSAVLRVGQAGRHRRLGRAGTHPPPRLARPRRRRGRRLRGPRRHGRPAVGRGRHRGAHAHLVGPGPPEHGTPRRLRGHPQGRALRRLPPHRPVRDPQGATAPATAWSRSGTACRSSRRSGPPGPQVVLMHHVHADMWRMVLPPNLAAMGDTARAPRRAAGSTGAAG